MRKLLSLSAVVVLLFASVAWSVEVRVATYNIKFLSTNVSGQGDRLEKLREVIELLEADVIGLQEIANRAALALVFPPSEWLIVIDDDSNNNQDVALVVRKPFSVLGIPPDLDADPEHFYFPTPPRTMLSPIGAMCSLSK